MGATSPDKSALDLSSSTVVKTSGGFAFVVNVTTAGSSTGALHDCAATGDAGDANLIATVPEAVGSYPFYGFPFKVGLVFVPGTDQVASVSYY